MTGTGRVSSSLRSGVICRGRNARRSGGHVPPWSAHACKKVLSQWCGLRPHSKIVCNTLFRPTTGVRRVRSAVLLSIE
jgi:hypothetical protein